MACLRDLRNVTFAEKLNTAKMELIHLESKYTFVVKLAIE